MKTENTSGRALFKVVRTTLVRNTGLSLLLLVTVLGSIFLALLPPLVLENLVNGLVEKREIEFSQAAFYFGVIILAGIFDAGKEMIITVVGQKITHGLRSEMCRKLSYLKASYYTENEAGVITSRLVNDVDAVEALFTNGIFSMCVDICKVTGIIVVIFTKSLGLGVILLAVTPILFKITRVFQRRMLKAQKDNRAAIGLMNRHIPETVHNIRTIHGLVKESYMEKQYDKKIQTSYHAIERANLYDSIYSPIVIMISTLLIAAVMVFSAMSGVVRTFFGMSVGTAVAIISYIGKVFDPIENIGMEIQNIQSAAAGITRIGELLGEEEQEETDGSITFDRLMKEASKGISFEKVDFSYDGAQQILHGLDLSIAPGEMVTLAGRTGAGKSTVFKLILGLYKPQEGSVRVFGAEASKIPHSEKRRLFGYVEQSFHMVPRTISDQIALYDDDITREMVVKAAKLAGIHEVIMSLPEDYATDCSEASFSQGQLQLLSIARAVAGNPPVMLLDEITANLDSITEHQVLGALERAADGRTVVSISHRLYERIGNRVITIG